MTVKYMLSAAAIVGALAFGLPAMAADNGDMNKPAEKSMDKPMDKSMDKSMDKPMHRRHHHALRHDSTSGEPDMHRASSHHRMHGAMGADAKERAQTEKLNQDQVQMNGTQH